MSDTQVRPLRAFAESLRLDQVNLTERWMRAVFHDTELSDADRLTYEQLSDHIPAILEEICSALEDQDLDQVEPAIERNARKHGKLRWKQGYRIDELVRELDLFRQMLAGQIVQFSESRPYFTRRHEERARHFIDEAVSFVTLTSIREVVTERDRKIDDYTGRLERANHELTLKQKLVGDLYESRMQITRSVVHDLRNFLNVFSMALQLMSRAPTKVEAALALANRQAVDMKVLVDELVEYSVVLGDTNPLVVEAFPLRELFDELVASCGPAIEAKGLRLSPIFDAGLSTVVSNRLKLKQVGLAGFEYHMPSQLSGGMKKRAAVARALAMDPEILFFDEPSAGLDPIIAAGIDKLILDLKKAFRMTIIVVTHELASAFLIADRMVLIDKGHIVASGTKEELRSSVQPRVRQFLDRVPEPDVEGELDYLQTLTEQYRCEP